MIIPCTTASKLNIRNIVMHANKPKNCLPRQYIPAYHYICPKKQRKYMLVYIYQLNILLTFTSNVPASVLTLYYRTLHVSVYIQGNYIISIKQYNKYMLYMSHFTITILCMVWTHRPTSILHRFYWIHRGIHTYIAFTFGILPSFNTNLIPYFLFQKCIQWTSSV